MRDVLTELAHPMCCTMAETMFLLVLAGSSDR